MKVRAGVRRVTHPSMPISTLVRIVALTSTLIALAGVTSASAAQCPNEALRTGPSAALPDCRAFEQVSPADKGGVGGYTTSALPAQVSSSGEALEYVNEMAFPGAEGNPGSAAHVSTRTGEGWTTVEWSPPTPTPTPLRAYLVRYQFSPDLSQAILKIPLIQLTRDAHPFMYNLYRTASKGAYTLLDSNPPAVPPEVLCPEPEELHNCWQSGGDNSTFAGASVDFSHVLFESNAQFTEDAPETGIESLYENFNGTVRLVGILPDEKPAATSTAGAGSPAEDFGYQSIERAISTDGLHVIFQATADGGEPDEAQSGLTEVYERINGEETVELSAPAPGPPPSVTTPQPAKFQSASVDGSRVFFTSKAELTTASNTGPANEGEDLYEYNFAKPPAERLTDLTVDSADSEGARVLGVVDSAQDGSYVYFVASGKLVQGNGVGVDGQPNLYVVHDDGQPVFIATLGTGSEERCEFPVDPCVWSPFPTRREAYVTPDGRHMTFMSSKSLPTVNFPGGYDNTDVITSEPDSQVYEYSAPTNPEEGGQLVCASCDPTGNPPVGKAVIGGVTTDGGGHEGKLSYSSISTPFYRVRAVSDNGGRVFYAAPASTVKPFDSVYEYEQSGEGTCQDVRGCHYLLSSVENTEADFFLGSNADGSNVFVATSDRLAGSDSDNSRDIYDARVGGGFTQFQQTRCESDCRQPNSPPTAPPQLASSSSGPSGNLLAPIVASTSRIKPPLTNAQKVSRALKMCRKARAKRSRASCEKKARAKYKPKVRAKKTDRKGNS